MKCFCFKLLIHLLILVPRTGFEPVTFGLAVSCSILPVHISYNEIGQSYKFSTQVSTLHRFYLFSLYHLTFGRFCPKVCHFILNKIILDYLFRKMAGITIDFIAETPALNKVTTDEDN